MPALSEIVDFLMSMMRNDKTKADFAKDPDGTLAGHGLQDVSGQDVRDAHLMMCDGGSVQPKPGHGGGGGGGGHHDDPVRAVQHITNNYEVTEIDESSHTSIGEINVLNIDDRDTTVIDSFNSDDDTSVVAVQDNDTINETTNTDVDVTNVEDSFNEGPAGPAPDPAPDPLPAPVFGETPLEQPAEVTLDDPVDVPAEDVSVDHIDSADSVPDSVPDSVDDPINDPVDDTADDGAFDPAVAG